MQRQVALVWKANSCSSVMSNISNSHLSSLEPVWEPIPVQASVCLCHCCRHCHCIVVIEHVYLQKLRASTVTMKWGWTCFCRNWFCCLLCMQCLNRNRNSELSELTRDGGIIIFEIPLWAIVQDIISTAEKTIKDQLYIFTHSRNEHDAVSFRAALTLGSTWGWGSHNFPTRKNPHSTHKHTYTNILTLYP